jgi:hypothetical protein
MRNARKHLEVWFQGLRARSFAALRINSGLLEYDARRGKKLGPSSLRSSRTTREGLGSSRTTRER